MMNTLIRNVDVSLHLESGTTRFTVDLRDVLPGRPDAIVARGGFDINPATVVLDGWDLGFVLATAFVNPASPDDDEVGNVSWNLDFVYHSSVRHVT